MSTINRLLSRREKHSNGVHGKKEPHNSSGPLHGLFVDEEKRSHAGKEEEKKIKIISQRLTDAGIKNFDEADVLYVLRTEHAKGDADKAYDLLAILQDSEEGIIQPYNPNVKLLGAVNRQAVTCYLDALLFAMFARLNSFEAMLYKNLEDPPKKRLSTLLRLWVNLLRAGKLITIDITKQIQLQLASCGWEDAGKVCQQDASEAFTFITDTLALPLLTLKMDIFHTGKEDASDDHKFINERLLELAIPDAPADGHTITLEECLEMYFNNKIEVKRYLDSLERRGTIGSVRSIDSTKASAAHVEIAEIEEGQPSSPLVRSPASPSLTSPVRPVNRKRAPSIIQETYIDEKKYGLDGLDGFDEKRSNHRRVKKEVMMPAWQFFSLIPWYTNNVPSNDAQVAAHFASTRPILGICLKRYYMTPNGKAVKRSTHIDIPLEIGLPHFIQDDNMSEDGPAFGNFKLSLQSIVCHQGLSVSAGHYISLARSPDPNRQGDDRWMRFDDLAPERVTSINVEKFLKESTQQTPYLLFYQVTPIEDDPGPAYSETAVTNDEPPPSYADSLASKESKTDLSTSMLAENGRQSLESTRRISLDLFSNDDSRRGRSSISIDRDPASTSPEQPATSNSSTSGLKIDVQPPPQDDQQNSKDDSTLQNSGPNTLTAGRRGSRSSKTSSKSGPSQSEDRAEKRMSASLSRLASRISRDRLSNSHINSNNNAIANTSPPTLPTVPATPTAALPQQVDPLASAAESTQSVPALTSPALENPKHTPKLILEVEKATERARLKKEGRDRTKERDFEKGKEKDVINAAVLAANQAGHKHHHHLTKAEGGGKPERECAVM